MMDKIIITDLKIPTTIGVYDWEKTIQQEVLLDLEFNINVPQAAAKDAIEDTTDYATIAGFLTDYIQQQSCELIETLANNCANLLQERFKLSWLKLTLKKPDAIENAKYVAVQIERSSL